MTEQAQITRLQSLVLREEGCPPGTEGLYVKGGGFTLHEGEVQIEKNGHLDFFSYFNVFNLKKWRAYTDMNNLLLQLRTGGRFRLRLFRRPIRKIQGRAAVPLFDGVFENETSAETVTVPVHNSVPGGLISIRIDALSGVSFKSGGWYTDTVLNGGDAKRVAVVICTYLREEYVRRNVDILRRHLPEGWNVFIVDNGRSLSESILELYDERFRIIPNPNTGGSGGFTRGLIEAIRDPVEWSHVLFMDDDVMIEPATLRRTDSFIQLLKPEYDSFFISGAMLRMDKPWMQHESTAYWSGSRVRHINHNYNLTESRLVAKNEQEEGRKNKYAAWWYCAVPLSGDHINDLPLPLFANGDDIEYSLRRAGGILRLNGISVWHEPFTKKQNPVKQFYLTVRNGLIINARSGASLLRSLIHINGRIVLQLKERNVQAVGLILLGVEDFLKGPGYLCSTDTAVLFRQAGKPTSNYPLGGMLRDILKTNIQMISKYSRKCREYGKMPLTADTWDAINRLACE